MDANTHKSRKPTLTTTRIIPRDELSLYLLEVEARNHTVLAIDLDASGWKVTTAAK